MGRAGTSPAPTKNRSTKKRERRGALPRTKLGGPDGRWRNLVTRLVLEAVVRVQLGAVGRILEVRPVILVESRRVLEALLVHVQDESLVLTRELHRLHRHCEQLVPHAEESAEREDRVADAAELRIDHQILDLAQVLAASVDDGI